jgi:hypothetical protein
VEGNADNGADNGDCIFGRLVGGARSANPRGFPRRFSSEPILINWRATTKQISFGATLRGRRLNKSCGEKLRNASILDQLSLPYPDLPALGRTHTSALLRDIKSTKSSNFFGTCSKRGQVHLENVEYDVKVAEECRSYRTSASRFPVHRADIGLECAAKAEPSEATM